VRTIRKLFHDRKGVSATEFALIAPVLFGFMIALFQVGMLFYANAGLNNALADGARLASLFPRPTNAQIAARIADRRFGLEPQFLSDPTFVTGRDNGADFTEITLRYSVPLDFVFFQWGPITLTETRRVYTHPAV
jgi:Flp pilus assembly protein TadG